MDGLHLPVGPHDEATWHTEFGLLLGLLTRLIDDHDRAVKAETRAPRMRDERGRYAPLPANVTRIGRHRPRKTA